MFQVRENEGMLPCSQRTTEEVEEDLTRLHHQDMMPSHLGGQGTSEESRFQKVEEGDDNFSES